MSMASKLNGQRQTAGKSNWNRTKTIAVIVVIVLLLLFARYIKRENGSGQQTQTQQNIPTVVTSAVERSDLAAAREYVGRVDPIQSVSLRPQISGEIAQVHFNDGTPVKAGQLLFSIDNKQFLAAADSGKADLEQAEANYDRAAKYFKRLQASDRRSVSAAALEAAESDMLQGRAAVEQAKAALQTARINLGYTKITAPISGRAGKAVFTKGNYVTPASELTTIVQTDPIRVTFSLPDKDYINQLEEFKASTSNVYDAELRLANGHIYPYKGERDFENNQIDASTGTMMLSMRYKNSSGTLVPGSMVRVTAKPSKAHIGLVIPQESVMADSSGDYVYVVGAADKVEQRRVGLGVNYGKMREVLSGLEAGEKVIIKGLQSVRDGAEVRQAQSRAAGTAAEPSEAAMESGYDLKPIVSGDDGGVTRETEEGKS